METYDAVILANGDYPSCKCSRDILEHTPFVCCCDDAAEEYILREGKMPEAIVGDGDSLPQDFKKQYASIYHEVREQEYNDLTKATRFCISKGCRRIAYLGTTGKREDHTIGNISLMTYYKREFNIEPVMVTDYGTFLPCKGRRVFNSFPRQQISIFNLSCTELKSDYLKWDAYPYKEFWQGTLNEALGNSFTLEGNGDYIVYLTHKPKS